MGIYDDLFRYNRSQFWRLPHASAVRMIDVLPGQHEDPMKCILRVVEDLTTTQPFDALSYYWGPADNSTTIICNQNDLKVTSSVDAALRRLRHSDHEIPLWIDAICINQDGLDERNAQVSLMRDIYTSARHVYIWLGECHPGTGDVFVLARTITLACAARAFGENVPVDDLENRMNPNTGHKEATECPIGSNWPLPTHPVWLELITLFQRPWFTRVWVCQEVLSTLNATVVCGSHKINWKMLGVASIWLWEKHASQIWDHLAQNGRDVEDPKTKVNQVSFLKMRRKATSYDSPFLRLIDLSMHFDASEPKDKIFALLYIKIFRFPEPAQMIQRPAVSPTLQEVIDDLSAEQKERISPVPTPHLDLQVDYRMPLEQLCREVSLRSIRMDHTLEALNLAWRLRTSDCTYPSWVGEWSAVLSDREPLLRPYLFHATLQTRPILYDSPKSVLKLEGVIVGSIVALDVALDLNEWLGTAGPNEDVKDIYVEKRLKYLASLLVQDVVDNWGEPVARRLNGQSEMTGSFAAWMQHSDLWDDSTDISWQDLQSVYKGTRGKPSSDCQPERCSDNLDETSFKDSESCNSPSSSGKRGLRSMLYWTPNVQVKQIVDHIATNHESSFFRDGLESALKYKGARTLFALDHDGMIGICSRKAVEGDIVVLLYGGRTPYILRQENTRYRLVADCYLHEAMDGQLLSDEAFASAHKRVFELI